MIFGDAQESVSATALCGWVRSQLLAALETSGLEATRAALIAAGQLEQAFGDRTRSRVAEGITDAAARAFVAAYRPSYGRIEEIRAPLRRALARLEALGDCEGPPEIKVPEGFAFYALFPEQYLRAARQWSSGHSPGEGTVLVVGIRSIGTALSAVVRAVLSTEGYSTRRCTVRPSGSPFNRTATLPPGAAQGAAWALLVDEGPGLSGSSLASAAFACEREGLERSRLAFFPAHDSPPGPAASETARECWKALPVCVGKPQEIPAMLAAESERLLGRPAVAMEEWSAGLWRAHCLETEERWPVSCPLLERRKFRCRLADGSALFWKFAGFRGVFSQNADLDFQRLQNGWAGRWTPEPLAICNGFVATRWVPARTVTAATPEWLAQAARYLSKPSGAEMTREEAQAAHGRVARLIAANLAPALAARAAKLWNAAAPRPSPLCEDPRLALHEWIQTPDGTFLKTDSTGHLCDHTLLGRQPAEWGWAAACNGSGLPGVAPLPQAMALGRERLIAYRIAHAAFRLGELELAALTAPPGEQGRVRREAEAVAGLARSLVSAADGACSGFGDAKNVGVAFARLQAVERGKPGSAGPEKSVAHPGQSPE